MFLLYTIPLPSRVPFQPLTCPTVHGARALVYTRYSSRAICICICWVFVCVSHLFICKSAISGCSACKSWLAPAERAPIVCENFNNKQPKTPTSTLGLNLRQLVNILCKWRRLLNLFICLEIEIWSQGKGAERARGGRRGSLAEGVAAAGLFRGQRWQRTHDKSCWPPLLLL